MCEHFATASTSDAGFEPSGLSMRIKLELPSEEWEGAVRSIGRVGYDDEPVQARHLLLAMIFKSPSWRQEGDREGGIAAGWHIADLEASVQSLNVSPGQVSLAREERRLARIVAYATAVAAVAAVASALAAWCGKRASQHEVGPDADKMESLMIEPSGMINEGIYETHRMRLQELRTEGLEYAERLREAAEVLEEGQGRPEDDQLLFSVPSPGALADAHQQIRATWGPMQRAMPQPKSPDTSVHR